MSVTVGNLRVATVAMMECNWCHKVMALDVTASTRRRMIDDALRAFDDLGWDIGNPEDPTCPFCLKKKPSS